MPVFEYKGLDSTGRAVKGTIDGENVKIARAKLRRQGLLIVTGGLPAKIEV